MSELGKNKIFHILSSDSASFISKNSTPFCNEKPWNFQAQLIVSRSNHLQKVDDYKPESACSQRVFFCVAEKQITKV